MAIASLDNQYVLYFPWKQFQTFPKYDTQNVSHTAIRIKEEIRTMYKPKIENYYMMIE